MKENPVFYKYKSLQSFEFLLDMVLKERLYAAQYNELNDPMEGVIKVDNTVPRDREQEWEKILSDLRIVCFTKDPKNSLMWSHYADGGKGCLIEFELLNGQECHKISYIKKPILNDKDITTSKAIEILKYKDKPWKYESEYRCILQNKNYLPVNTKSITFGPRSSSDSVTMLMHILALCKPDLKVNKMSEIGVFKDIQFMVRSGRLMIKEPAESGECVKCAEVKMMQRHFVGMHRNWENY